MRRQRQQEAVLRLKAWNQCRSRWRQQRKMLKILQGTYRRGISEETLCGKRTVSEIAERSREQSRGRRAGRNV